MLQGRSKNHRRTALFVVVAVLICSRAQATRSPHESHARQSRTQRPTRRTFTKEKQIRAIANSLTGQLIWTVSEPDLENGFQIRRSNIHPLDDGTGGTIRVDRDNHFAQAILGARNLPRKHLNMNCWEATWLYRIVAEQGAIALNEKSELFRSLRAWHEYAAASGTAVVSAFGTEVGSPLSRLAGVTAYFTALAPVIGTERVEPLFDRPPDIDAPRWRMTRPLAIADIVADLRPSAGVPRHVLLATGERSLDGGHEILSLLGSAGLVRTSFESYYRKLFTDVPDIWRTFAAGPGPWTE